MGTGDLKKTPLWGWHRENGAKMADFGGWDMPLLYRPGILKEHLATRRYAGLFDVSHMGRFQIGGNGATDFLKHVLSSDVEALKPWHAQYAFLPNRDGGVIDDVYLYRLGNDDYLLVVNASNRREDWEHLSGHAGHFHDVTLEDHTDDMGMIALQGPESGRLLESLADAGSLPEPLRNRLSEITLCGTKTIVARTGYTGEPVGFELFMDTEQVETIWSRILEVGQRGGILPVGLGARDTLRLEAGLPLYGHELGVDPDGRPMPAFALPLASVAVSFSEGKGDFIGREALMRQSEEAKTLREEKPLTSDLLPRRIRPLAILDKGIARSGDVIFAESEQIGVVTSGTMAPYWQFDGPGATASITEQTDRRAIALAHVDACLMAGRDVEVEVRGRRLRACIVRRHGMANTPPYFRAVLSAE